MKKSKFVFLMVFVLVVLAACGGGADADWVDDRDWDEERVIAALNEVVRQRPLPFDQAGIIDVSVHVEVETREGEEISFSSSTVHAVTVSDGIFWETTTSFLDDDNVENITIITVENGEMMRSRGYVDGRITFEDSSIIQQSMVNYEGIDFIEYIISAEVEFYGDYTAIRVVICGEAVTESIRRSREEHLVELPYEVISQMSDIEHIHGDTYYTLILDAVGNPMRMYAEYVQSTVLQGETTINIINSTTIFNRFEP